LSTGITKSPPKRLGQMSACDVGMKAILTPAWVQVKKNPGSSGCPGAPGNTPASGRRTGTASSLERSNCQRRSRVRLSAFFAIRWQLRGIILRRGEWLSFGRSNTSSMKFGEKYELLESLTTGAVETFVANDKVRGERVLVHILHGDPQKPNQPTVQWVLDSFRRVAPEPVGLVLETGRYSGTLYAYLVTKLPEETALRGWVRQYKAQARDTQEMPAPAAPPPPPTPESKAPTAEMAVKDLPQPPVSASPVSVTQLLRDFDPPAKSAVPSPPLTPPAPRPMQPGPLPPISSAGGQSGLHSAPPWAPESSRIPPAPQADPNAGSPAESFRPDFAARNFPSPITAPPAKEGPKLGEFTSFFQGPFRGDVPSETPAVSPRQEAPQKPVGDFTSVFGSVKAQREEPPPAAGIAGNEPAGSFTGWFAPEVSQRISSTAAPPGLPRANPAPGLSASPQPASGLHAPNLAESGLPAPNFPAANLPTPAKEAFTPPKPASYVAPAPPIFPIPVPSNPPTPKPPMVSTPSMGSDGATGAFSRPAGDVPLAPVQEVPSGPSSYTRIISARPSAPAEAANAEAPRAAGSPGFATPALAVPAMAPPPLPPPPVAPKPAFAAPAAPKMPAAPKLPAAPKAPKVGAPEPPVSYWPLILILTVLFFAGVLLVLYFVLKH